MRTRLTGLTALTAVAALALAACGNGNGEEEPTTDPGAGDETATEEPADEAADFPEGSTMAELNEAGEITIGTKFDQPLFGLVAPDGRPEGFDVEIAKIIATELGIPEDGIDWTETISANREPYIENGTVDIVVATYTINDERKQVVDFAGPYYTAGQSLLVTTDNTEITGPESLGAGVTVCTVEGSTPAANLRDQFPDVELELFGAYSDCLEPLRNGQVDALSTDNVILSGYVAEAPDDFKLVGDLFTEEPYGIGLQKGDDEFRNWINDVLEAAIEDGRWEQAWESTAGQYLDTPEPPEIDRY